MRESIRVARRVVLEDLTFGWSATLGQSWKDGERFEMKYPSVAMKEHQAA
jgi:hypothetical protein